MAQSVTWNGISYSVPDPNDTGWAPQLTAYLVALPAGALQKSGGTFTLTSDVDFGASFSLKSLSYKSRSSNISATGIFRMANAETGIGWRNALNNADLLLTVNSSNVLTFNGTPIQSNVLTSAHIFVGNGSNVATDVAMSGHIAIDNTGATTLQAGVVTNAMVNASAAIAQSKMAALTINRALVSDASGFVAVSSVTSTELGYVAGVTSAIQTQLGLLAPRANPTFTGTVTLAALSGTGDATFSSATLTAVNITSANVGSPIGATIFNTDNTNTASDSELFLKVGGTAGGNAYLRFNVPATTNWTMGLNNADTDAFIINSGAALNDGTNVLRIDKTTQGVAIRGTNTNNNATTAFVGEYIESVISSATNVPGGNTAWGDGTSISLTAGDWEVSASAVFLGNAATFTRFQLGISTTTGNSSTGLVQGSNQLDAPLPVSGTRGGGVSIPGYRISIASTTIVYMKIESDFSSGTPQFTGRLSARRFR